MDRHSNELTNTRIMQHDLITSENCNSITSRKLDIITKHSDLMLPEVTCFGCKFVHMER